MKKRVTPLRAGRGSARPASGLLTADADFAQRAYPFEDICPDLRVRISAQARRMALRLDPKKREMNLVIPRRATLKNAYRFAHEHKDWIREKINELPRPVFLTNGSVIPVFGRDRKIIVLYNEALKFTDIQLKKNELLVLTNKRDPAPRIRRFLMDEAKERISLLAHDKAAKIRRRIKDIQVKDTTSRWGSCSDDGKLSFSWRLIFAPSKSFDYVVAHEVAHLCYMDHSDNFWAICDRLSKDYEEGKEWMRLNGSELMRYDG